jgi:hypothetical protein
MRMSLLDIEPVGATLAFVIFVTFSLIAVRHNRRRDVATTVQENDQ